MTRLIDADALLAKINNAEPINLGWITDQITNAPTVQREGWVSVPIDLLKDITNCFDNVPSRAHVADGVDDNLKRISQWVNSSDGGYGLYQAVNSYLIPVAPTPTDKGVNT